MGIVYSGLPPCIPAHGGRGGEGQPGKRLQKMIDIDFFSYPRGFNPTLEGEVIGVPSHFSNYYLEFRNESGTKIVQWSSRYWAPNDNQYQNLFELSGLIQDLIEAKPEYQRLPTPTAGYV